ncbi:hypothetical protein D9M73_132680 [compost metagenome]
MIGRDQGVAVCSRFSQARADHQKDVGLLDPRDQFGVRPITEIASPYLVGVGDGILPPEGSRDRKAPQPRKVAERSTGGQIPTGTTHDRHRCLALADSVEGTRDQVGIGYRIRPFHPGPVYGHHFIEQHILGQCQHHRPRSARHGDVPGARDIFGDAAGVVDLGGPFGDGAKHRGKVDFLKGLAVLGGAVDIADEQHHRLRILHRDMDANRGIGGTGPARDEGDAGPPGQRAIGTRHEADPAFLTAHHQIDFGRVVQRI